MAADTSAPVLTGPRLILAGFVLALTNFMVVLDTTIANVSVPHISGGLGVSPTQGTWVVTSYSVAEAICVPLGIELGGVARAGTEGLGGTRPGFRGETPPGDSASVRGHGARCVRGELRRGRRARRR